MPQFYTLLTDTGQAKLANAVALGDTIEITELAVGDGNGSLPTPDSSAEALINEVRRAAINTSQTDPNNPSWIVVEQVLPPDVGGWTIREIGIYDVDGDLIGIGNYPETYKPVLAEGSSRTQTVRFVLEVSDTGAVTLKVDPSVVLATREYVDQERTEHEASRAHPTATESLQGMIKRASWEKARAGEDNADAMTALRVFEMVSQWGLGAAGSVNSPELSDFADRDIPSGLYWANGAANPSPTPNAPPGTGANRLSVLAININAEMHWIVQENSSTPDSTHRLFFGNSMSSGNGVVWNQAFQNADIATQSETDSGSADNKLITPKKLKNWAAGWVKQATETVAGMLKVSSQAQVDAGADDTTALTPKKLRWGVVYSMGQNGYIVFPSWLGGFIVQWGLVSHGSTSGTVSFPIAFPNESFGVFMTDRDGPGNEEYYAVNFNGVDNGLRADEFDFVTQNAGSFFYFSAGC